MTSPAAFLLPLLLASQAPAPAVPAPSGGSGNPVVEVGVTRHDLRAEVGDDLGPWHVLTASVSWQPPFRVRPVIDVDRQTRPGGGHERVGGGVYVDWTRRVYSYQAVSWARTARDAARFYPRLRADARVFFKTAETGGVSFATGYTALTFGAQRSQIVNIGTVLYSPRVIAQGTVYINRNDPGGLYSAAGNLSLQVGAEGRRWYGFSVGGGRELYRVGTFASTATADFKTVTTGVFIRQWLTSRAGMHATAEYQRVAGSYSRLGLTARWFVGF